jgi:protein-S-isoprenylcysteine O-methyltransferase Ste14
LSVWRHVLAVCLLPGTVTIAVPVAIVRRTGSVDVGWGLPDGLGLAPAAAGGVVVALGLSLLVRTVALFVSVGRGTLAPWDPTRRLVVRGPYRRVRNPMISGVLFVLLGEAALLGSRPLAIWFAACLAVNAVYLPLIEEPGLRRRFGEEYELYRAHVPRWVPRLRPWDPA